MAKAQTDPAAAVPDTSPQNPPHAEVRFQNTPRMKVTKTGAWKKENSACRYSLMLLYWAAMNAVPMPMITPTTVITRPNRR